MGTPTDLSPKPAVRATRRSSSQSTRLLSTKTLVQCCKQAICVASFCDLFSRPVEVWNQKNQSKKSIKKINQQTISKNQNQAVFVSKFCVVAWLVDFASNQPTNQSTAFLNHFDNSKQKNI